ncbi:M20 metallopeptidase family protein [Mucisphaera calidilacus]|nr:amidohydrolase [Mucisphaera calidilacus]
MKMTAERAARVADLGRRVDAEFSTATELRHDLHAHPQLAYEETYASELVQRELGKAGIEFTAGLATTGVVGVIRCAHHGPEARAVALRADMDALPITEATGLPYASQNPGCMHACGHDGHTAGLLGAARVLARLAEEEPEALPRPVKLIFQPAEEDGAGARQMVRDGALSAEVGGVEVERIFGLHGWNDSDVGTFKTMPGPMMACTLAFRVRLVGQGGHAASPHETRDPVPAVAALIGSLQSIVSRGIRPAHPGVVTVANVHAGEGAENVIPGEAVINGTARTFDLDDRAFMERRIHEITNGTAAAYGCAAEVETREGYPVTVNDPEATALMVGVAREVLGDENVTDLDYPLMGAEDFSFYAHHVPACFGFVGVRPAGRASYPCVHTPEFDFTDETLRTSMRVLCGVAVH